MGTSGNRDCQWASKSALEDFPEDALSISAGSLFQNGTVHSRIGDGAYNIMLVELVGMAALPLVGRRLGIPGDHGLS